MAHASGTERCERDARDVSPAALDALGLEDPEKAEVVKLRYFVGLTFEETADVLGISERTVRRHWAYARAWLFAEIKDLR